jgi:hypothetical protein
MYITGETTTMTMTACAVCVCLERKGQQRCKGNKKKFSETDSHYSKKNTESHVVIVDRHFGVTFFGVAAFRVAGADDY